MVNSVDLEVINMGGRTRITGEPDTFILHPWSNKFRRMLLGIINVKLIFKKILMKTIEIDRSPTILRQTNLCIVYYYTHL